MGTQNIPFFCLIAATTLCFGFQSINSSSSSSAPPLTILTARRALPESSFSPYKQQQEEYQNFKVNVEMTRSRNLEGSAEIEYPGSDDNAEELVYHIDYHGVTTHPNPTPKHP